MPLPGSEPRSCILYPNYCRPTDYTSPAPVQVLTNLTHTVGTPLPEVALPHRHQRCKQLRTDVLPAYAGYIFTERLVRCVFCGVNLVRKR